MQCTFSALPEKMRHGTFVSALQKGQDKSAKLIIQANILKSNCFIEAFEQRVHRLTIGR